MKIGLWIDHTKAVVVSISGKKETITVLESNINRHFRSSPDKNDSSPNGRRNVTPDDIQERGFKEHLSIFYKRVISYLRKAESIYIFGPGEPKEELERIIKKSNLLGHLADIDTTDRMTDRQIAAKTRNFFHDLDRRAGSKAVTGHNKPKFHVSRRSTDFV